MRFASALIEFGDLRVGDRVFELGCGTGILGMCLQGMAGVEVFACDPTLSSVKLAATRVHCSCGTLESIRLDSGARFRLVYCKDVLPLISNRSEFFKAVLRLLSAGGKFISYVPDKGDFAEKPLYKFIKGSLGRSKSKYGTPATLENIMRSAGFQDVSMRRIPLGPVSLNGRYIEKHEDGYFSNTDAASFACGRAAAVTKWYERTASFSDIGIVLSYEWERTLVVGVAP